MTRSFSCLLVLGISITALAAMASADENKEELIKKDRQQIEGTWRIVGVDVNGTAAKDEDLKKMMVVNKSDGTWTLLSEGKEISKGTSEIDPTQKPKTIDFTQTEGDGKASQYLGIYQLGGKTRKMCFAPPGKPRPSEFVSTAESGNILVRFERKSNE